MTPEDFISNLENAIEKTVEDLKPTMEEAALTAKALIARRVQNTGFGRRYTSRSYVKLRAAKGYEIRFVNLTYTGRMFRGWKRPGTVRTGLKVTGTVGGVDVETINKLKWNKSRYPQFDKVNEDERKLLIENLIRPRVVRSLQHNIFRK
ncbi:hypothetical protein [Gaetbulibacter sp. PBL-D1]|uniref:hypothetical protein n=1 Tax=Gaetbulibacter sp. PBL-D1 TaxID=3422594 RepID=UPI003D2F0D22